MTLLLLKIFVVRIFEISLVIWKRPNTELSIAFEEAHKTGNCLQMVACKYVFLLSSSMVTKIKRLSCTFSHNCLNHVSNQNLLGPAVIDDRYEEKYNDCDSIL